MYIISQSLSAVDDKCCVMAVRISVWVHECLDRGNVTADVLMVSSIHGGRGATSLRPGERVELSPRPPGQFPFF